MKIVNFDASMLESKDIEVYSFLNPYSYFIIDEYVDKDKFIFFADGISLVLLERLFGNSGLSRFSFDFTSLASIIFPYAEERQLSVALVGGTESEVELAKITIQNKYSNLVISFTHHGYIKDDFLTVVEKMNVCKPDIVICGMGTPLQEAFILYCKDNVQSMRLGFTCGGFLSQIASNKDYFSPMLSRLHLRWFQRFLRHGYVRKRLLIDYPLFLVKYCFRRLVKQ